jgi:tRNA(Met) cytidine acetyltransferase
MNANINIVEAQNLPDLQRVFESLGRLSRHLQQTSQRVMINCRGTREWCLAIAQQQAGRERCIVFSDDSDLSAAIPFSKAERLLGSEADCVVYDGSAGINIDVLCMAAGLLRSGGYLLLLTPPHPQQMEDRFGIWQGSAGSQAYFLQHFFNQLEQQCWVLRESDAGAELAAIVLADSIATSFVGQLAEQQSVVYQQMREWWEDRSKPIFILTADRGRGKSTLLGMFASQLQHDTNIVVTAAAKAQSSVVLRQLGQASDNVHFMAPDEIIRRHQPIDCLIIDEAAMLPSRLLQQCMGMAKKNLIATTTGGYEGTGGGFLLKFLKSLAPARFIHTRLQQPIRWGEQDALEEWMNRVLLLKWPLHTDVKMRSDLEIKSIDKKLLAQDARLLESVYGLLVSAHYRTRPSDLRQLMEDENQQLMIAVMQKQVVGVLLLNREGGFDTEIAQEIFMGRRRPQGHLLAQMLTAQAGIPAFARLRGLRVQRIAVDESCRRQGIGRQLINAAIQFSAEQQFDYIGSCFAADSTVLPFWNAVDFELLHIASGKGIATAQQTVAVIKTLHGEVNKLLQDQRCKIKNYLPLWLQSYCRDMGWQEIVELLKILNIKYQLSDQECNELRAFGQGYRGFEYTLGTLQRFLISVLPQKTRDASEIQLAVEKILQNKSWSLLSESDGKKHSLKKLRGTIAGLIEHD